MSRLDELVRVGRRAAPSAKGRQGTREAKRRKGLGFEGGAVIPSAWEVREGW